MPQERSVLIMGGGVAALAAAAALVEHNRDKAGRTGTHFKITVLTSDDVWGGRASSWAGGGERLRYEHTRAQLQTWDFRSWPPELPLNHGFHAVFDETTYVNFWYTLKLAGLTPEELKGRTLISNEHEILVHEAEAKRVCRLQVHDPDRYPFPFNSHLTEAARELLLHGKWSPLEIYSLGTKVVQHLLQEYADFDELIDLDLFQRISFEKWCRDRGVRASVFNKMMFKFLFQGTYIAPNTMDATSGLMGLWVILRHMNAAQWYYINGGITEKLMKPIADFLAANGVRLRMKQMVTALYTDDGYSTIERYEMSGVEVIPALVEDLGPFDFFINTLPLDSTVKLLKHSGPSNPPPPGKELMTLLEGFPDIKTLEKDKRFPDTAGTVNLQAWFQEPGLLSDNGSPTGDYRNVIAGLEPLCVIIDYKNVLPMYRNDPRFPGSVLEINGSLQELQSPEHYGYFECDVRFGNPNEAKTIDFAKTIMIDIADRYCFPELRKAVEREAFLDWPEEWEGRQYWPGRGTKIPPFLWQNRDPYNRFFVTGPGTLQYRPWIWRGVYPDDYIALREAGYPGPKGYPDNLFLAGDWTRNGFDIPSMEGAARSGRMAALALIKTALGIADPTADPTQPKPAVDDPDFIKVFDPF
jgi:hypothetical protein